MVEDFKKEDEALALLFIRGKMRDCVTFATLLVPRSLSLKRVLMVDEILIEKGKRKAVIR